MAKLLYAWVSEKRLFISAKTGVLGVPQSSRTSETSDCCAKTLDGAVKQINASNANHLAAIRIISLPSSASTQTRNQDRSVSGLSKAFHCRPGREAEPSRP